MHLESK